MTITTSLSSAFSSLKRVDLIFLLTPFMSLSPSPLAQPTRSSPSSRITGHPPPHYLLGQVTHRELYLSIPPLPLALSSLFLCALYVLHCLSQDVNVSYVSVFFYFFTTLFPLNSGHSGSSIPFRTETSICCT